MITSYPTEHGTKQACPSDRVQERIIRAALGHISQVYEPSVAAASLIRLYTPSSTTTTSSKSHWMATLSGPRIPSIVVTPALPSRNSLSLDMRATLDSIIGPASSVSTPQPYADAIDWTAYGVAPEPNGEQFEEHEDTEVPHTLSRTPPAAAEDDFRLDVDLRAARFSVGEVVSALEAAYHSASSRGPAEFRGPVADGASGAPTLCERADVDSGLETGSGYVVAADDVSLACSEPTVLQPSDNLNSHGGDTDADEARPVARRTPTYVDKGDPARRHAIYISTMLWPVKTEGRSANKWLSDAAHFPIRSKTRWPRMRLLSRAFTLGCTRHYSEI
ncbi:hypothetical protein BD413DRAFT_577426 [Trametes elegans]|nr:hypothetical protein BD413DRAFT_577426 [Trametes elegans]